MSLVAPSSRQFNSRRECERWSICLSFAIEKKPDSKRREKDGVKGRRCTRTEERNDFLISRGAALRVKTLTAAIKWMNATFCIYLVINNRTEIYILNGDDCLREQSQKRLIALRRVSDYGPGLLTRRINKHKTPFNNSRHGCIGLHRAWDKKKVPGGFCLPRRH